MTLLLVLVPPNKPFKLKRVSTFKLEMLGRLPFGLRCRGLNWLKFDPIGGDRLSFSSRCYRVDPDHSAADVWFWCEEGPNFAESWGSQSAKIS